MDPVSLAGLAIGVASIGLQVYTSCIQGRHPKAFVASPGRAMMLLFQLLS